MLKERLEGHADVFIFDAWAHEGDPLRRTFLERLIDFLSQENADTELAQLKESLRLRKKIQVVTTTPVLTMEAKLLTFAILLVPVGLAILSVALGKQDAPEYVVRVGLVLLLLPMIILLPLVLGAGLRAIASAAASRFTTRRLALWFASALFILAAIAARHTTWLMSFAGLISSHRATSLTAASALLAVLLVSIFKSRAPSEWSELFPLLLNKTVTTSRSESVESPDPSSVEFQHSFAAIVNVHERRKKRLVIAIDNLDRVDPFLALQLWATMRTFFEFDFERNPWAASVWLLAAFDVNALHRLWPEEAQAKKDFSYHPQSWNSTETFVNKTFQASFSVPGLVLLNRDEYLFTQLRRAFPGHDDSEFRPIIQLYDLKYVTEISTPRAITNFVNAIGSIHRQWQDEIPLIQQAQYVLASHGKSNVADVLTETPPEVPEQLVGPNWRDSLAAIHFNVPIADAAHVFMAPPLTASLVEGDFAKLLGLSKMPGFGRVLEDAVMRNQATWLNTEGQSLPNAVFALAAAGLDENDAAVRTAWDWLVRAACHWEKWAPMTNRTGAALAALVRQSRQKGQIETLLKAAGQSLPRADDKSIDSSDQGFKNWVESMKPVLEMLPSLPDNCGLVVTGSAETYVNLLIAVKGAFGVRFDGIAARLSTEAKDRVPIILGETIRNGRVAENFPQLVKVLAVHKMNLNWSPVTQAVEEIFNSLNNNMKQPFFGITLKAALVLSNSAPAAVTMLENLAAMGYLHNYLASVGFEQERSGVVALLALLLFSKGDPKQWPGHAKEAKSWYSGNELTGPAQDSMVLRAVADLVVELSQVERMRSATKHSPTASKLMEMIGK